MLTAYLTCMDLAIAYCFHLTHPVALVFLAQGLANEAYTTCSSILAQLGEAVPDIVTEEMVGDIIPETLSMYSEICGDDWLGTKMEDTKLCNIVKFYSLLTTAAYFCKPSSGYFVCRTIQMSLQNGVCEYTPIAVMKLSSIAFNKANDTKFSNASLIQ